MTLRAIEVLLVAPLLAAACSNTGSATSTTASGATSATSASIGRTATVLDSKTAMALEPKTMASDLAVLKTSRDRAALERAAVELAGSGDPAALRSLGELLRNEDFLARLDDVKSLPDKTYHLRRVMLTLEGHPTAETGALCLRLLADPTFLADPDRKIFALAALAEVRPMSEETAAAFKRANAEGYFSMNLPLLAKNASPRALGLFEAMVRDRSRDVESRVADIHNAVLPRRTDPELLRAIDRLLSSADLEDGIAAGLIETVFDHQSRRWFGPERTPPAPPPWQGAPPETLDLVIALSARAHARKGVPGPLLEAVARTTATVRALAGR